MSDTISPLFDGSFWGLVPGFTDLADITYHQDSNASMVRVGFNRPEVRNAFRPQTVDELCRVLEHSRLSTSIGVVIITGNGPSQRDGIWAFCSGGDQRFRGPAGYEPERTDSSDGSLRPQVGRLHILEVQRLIRFMPKVVIAAVSGWTAGGGHSLHVVCDLSIASKEHAIFKQTDANVGSFDGGLGSTYLARQVGQKFAREIFFLGEEYDAQRALAIGAVNSVVAHENLEKTAISWGGKILRKSPTSIRMLKFAMNSVDDGLIGQQIFAGEATRLAYGTEEAKEGRDAFLSKREPNWSNFPWQV